MTKETFELKRDTDHIYNYGQMYPPYSTDSISTMDFLVEWSKRPENKDKVIYKHYIRQMQENPRPDDDKELIMCDLVYYIDIFSQISPYKSDFHTYDSGCPLCGSMGCRGGCFK